MRPNRTLIAYAMATLFTAVSGAAHADGLADLKSALERLHGQAPVKAVVEAKTWSRHGDGKDADESSGVANVTVEDGARGLQTLISKDMLARAESEETAKDKDPKAKTPTLTAMSEIGSSALRPMLSAARSLTHSLDKAQFKSEKVDNFGGKPARLLTFDIPVESISEKDRKYIKKFDSSLSIWIAADGTPLASRLAQNLSGRAMMVVTFENNSDEQNVYTVVGDRLVSVRREVKNSGGGMGEKMESRTTKTLQLQS
jgi:hypothetical protein